MLPGKSKKSHHNKISEENRYYRLEDNRLFLLGELKTNRCDNLVKFIKQKLESLKLRHLLLDLSRLEDIDSAGVITIFYIRDMLTAKKIEVEFAGASKSVSKKIELFRPVKKQKKTPPPAKTFLESTGEKTYLFFTSYLYEFFLLASNVFFYSLKDIFNTKSRRKGEFVNQSVLIGVNAVWIVILMSYIIGLVVSLHSAGQLRDFGADIFIVDITVIGIMRQMGPLITAILVAGRSSSAIAAEIATMKVTTELDALKTMGLDPVRFVVVPKIYASMFTMPFLVLIANAFGIAGGATAAYSYLDIPPEIFINRMSEIVQSKDLLTGLVKSQAYAVIIVLTGAFYGFRVERGAEGVGRVTTEAVVVAISLVILADSVLGLLFY